MFYFLTWVPVFMILNYYGENDADATVDFFIEEDNEIILFITAHEEVIQVHKKFYNAFGSS